MENTRKIYNNWKAIRRDPWYHAEILIPRSQIGVDGGGCVSLTALGVIDSGYKVTLNTACIGTVFEKQRDKYYKRLREKGATFI